MIQSLEHFLSCCSALSARAVKEICKEQVLSWSQDQKIMCSHCRMYLSKDLPELPIQALWCCISSVKAPAPVIMCLCESLWLCTGKKYQKCDTPKNLPTRKQVKNVSTNPVHTAFVCSWDAWGLQHLWGYGVPRTNTKKSRQAALNSISGWTWTARAVSNGLFAKKELAVRHIDMILASQSMTYSFFVNSREECD